MATIEILAPAGAPEHLIPALRSGANAVYLGLKTMNARARAENFTTRELREAVPYCHARDVKVYLALNTLIKDREMQEALEAARLACDAGVDALIVQDPGLAAMIRRAAPDMPLHASTQMSVHTPGGVRLLYESGFRRVVLARECSQEEIRAIAASCPIELEVFVHGALCMSVSGQCYFSAMLGGRSGNRGQCAQPCRLPFRAAGTGYALSLKDLSIIDRLPALQEMGVTSAKIEGRMKRPEYVAAAVRACRSVLDNGIIDAACEKQLASVFSRSGFTSGYFDDKLGRDMFGIRLKEDVTAATQPLLADIRRTYKDEPRRIPVSFSLYAAPGKATRLTVREAAPDAAAQPVTVEGPVAENAVNRPLEADRCRAQLLKTGGTPFVTAPGRVEVVLSGAPSLPLSEINRLRREALDQLLVRRSERNTIPWYGTSIPYEAPERAAPAGRNRRGDRVPIRAHFPSAALPRRAKDLELCYVPLFTPPERLKKRMEEGFPLGVELPRGMFSLENRVQSALARAYAVGVRDAWTGNLGGIPLIRNAGMRLHGGFSLNVWNARALEELMRLGAVDCELSIELSRGEIAGMPKAIPAGVVVYGCLPLMLTRNCPLHSGGRSCDDCSGSGALTDRKDVEFPVVCVGACSEVYNALPLEMSDRLREIEGVHFISIRFTVENIVETEEKLQQYFDPKVPETSYTRGLFERSVE